jgi:hypothetical protein
MGMERDGKSKCKVVWLEGQEPHSVWATPIGEEDCFLLFTLSNGVTLRLQKSAVVKIEEGLP